MWMLGWATTDGVALPTPIALWEFSTDESPFQPTIGTNNMYRGAATANPTHVAEAGGISAHVSLDSGDTLVVSNTAWTAQFEDGFALAFWAKRTRADKYGSPKYIGQAGRWYFEEQDQAANDPHFRIIDDDSAGHSLSTEWSSYDYTTEIDEWRHWVMWWDGGTSTNIYMFQNGVSVGEAPVLVAWNTGMETTLTMLAIPYAVDALDPFDFDTLAVYNDPESFSADVAQALFDDQKGSYGY